MTTGSGRGGATLILAAVVAAASAAAGCAGDDVDDGAVAAVDGDGATDSDADADRELRAALARQGKPRLIAPLSGSVVGASRPRVTWSGGGRARVDFCRDSAAGA